MVRALQRRWPRTRLTWIVGRTEAQLVGDLSGVEFIIFDKRQGLSAYNELRRALAGRRFDVLLHMQASLHANLASLLIRAPVRIGFDRPRARNLQSLFINRRIAGNPRVHLLEEFFQFLESLEINERELRWDIPVPETARAFAERCLPGGPWLVVNPCATSRPRNRTVEGYARLIDYAFERYGLRTALTGAGSMTERTIGNMVATRCQHPLVSLIGRTTLKDLLAVITRAEAVIAPDAVPLHMATAAGTPAISLYAASNPEHSGPYLSRVWTVNRYTKSLRDYCGLSVEQAPWGQRVRHPEAMEKITFDDVAKKLDGLMMNSSVRLSGH